MGIIPQLLDILIPSRKGNHVLHLQKSRTKIFYYISDPWSPGSADSKVTRLWAEGGILTQFLAGQEIFLFSKGSRPATGPT
jgi:hypothetical protein